MTYLANHLIDGKIRIYFQWVWVVMTIIRPPLMVRVSNDDHCDTEHPCRMVNAENC